MSALSALPLETAAGAGAVGAMVVVGIWLTWVGIAGDEIGWTGTEVTPLVWSKCCWA